MLKTQFIHYNGVRFLSDWGVLRFSTTAHREINIRQGRERGKFFQFFLERESGARERGKREWKREGSCFQFLTILFF